MPRCINICNTWWARLRHPHLYDTIILYIIANKWLVHWWFERELMPSGPPINTTILPAKKNLTTTKPSLLPSYPPIFTSHDILHVMTLISSSKIRKVIKMLLSHHINGINNVPRPIYYKIVEHFNSFIEISFELDQYQWAVQYEVANPQYLCSERFSKFINGDIIICGQIYKYLELIYGPNLWAQRLDNPQLQKHHLIWEHFNYKHNPVDYEILLIFSNIKVLTHFQNFLEQIHISYKYRATIEFKPSKTAPPITIFEIMHTHYRTSL